MTQKADGLTNGLERGKRKPPLHYRRKRTPFSFEKQVAIFCGMHGTVCTFLIDMHEWLMPWKCENLSVPTTPPEIVIIGTHTRAAQTRGRNKKIEKQELGVPFQFNPSAAYLKSLIYFLSFHLRYKQKRLCLSKFLACMIANVRNAQTLH